LVCFDDLDSFQKIIMHRDTVSIARLTSETVKGLSLTLESIDDVHCHDSLAAGVLSVGYRVTDDVLEEYLEDSTGLLVDKSRDTLDSTTTGETADSGLGNSLDVVAENLTMTLSSSLSESLSSFTAA
jgi:hypothetical protein